MFRFYFWLNAKKLNFFSSARNTKSSLASAGSITKLTIVPVLIAIIFAISMQLTSPYFEAYLLQYIEAQLLVKDDFYITLMATIAGMGAIFIGLYYASISAVSSTIYAKVPSTIRNLLSQENFGNVYLRFLSFLTFVCIILIAMRTIGLPVVQIAIPIITLLAGIGVISFVILGRRAFSFFDPTSLSYHIFIILEDSLQSAIAGGYRWNDQSFQAHAHKRAAFSLETLKSLGHMTSNEFYLRGAPFVELSARILLFLSNYEGVKRKIPTESKWYKQIYKQPDWYLTDDSSISTAHQTGTRLQPKIIVSEDWVEVDCLQIVKKCFEVNLLSGDYSNVINLLEFLQTYLKSVSVGGNTNRSLVYIEEFSAIYFNHLPSITPEKLIEIENLATIDRLSNMMILSVLEFRKSCSTMVYENSKKQISSIDWSQEADIYSRNFPQYILPSLEWLRPRLNYENRVKRKFVTPAWYNLDFIMLAESKQFISNTSAIVRNGIEYFESSINSAESKGQILIAAALISSEWEYWHKVNYQKDYWFQVVESFENKRKTKDLTWPSFDLEQLFSEVESRRKALISKMSALNIQLHLEKRPETFPDYAGQFLHTTGESIVESLIENDQEFIATIFPSYLVCSMLKFEDLKTDLPSDDWRNHQRLKVALAPIIDIISVSGYSKLLADFHGNQQLWTSITKCWDNYLNETKEYNTLPILVAALSLSGGIFESPHRSVMRFNWQRRIRDEFTKLPRKEVTRSSLGFTDNIVVHESSLVRVFAEDRYGSHYDGENIFSHFYFSKLKEAEVLELAAKTEYLEKSLERNEKEYESEGFDKEGM